MKTLVWAIFLIIVLFSANYTIEGATSAPTSVEITQSPYALSFVRPVTYNYRYPFDAIRMEVPYNINTSESAKYYFGVISPTGESKSKHDSYYKKMDNNLKTNGKKTIAARLMLHSRDEIPKIIRDSKITEVAVIMRMYDLIEKAFDKYDSTKVPVSFSMQVIYPIPVMTSSNKNETKYIQRAINYPKLTST